MIVLLTDIITPRLQYIAEFIFKDAWQVEYTITTNSNDFDQPDVIKINYSENVFAGNVINVQGSRLLFEKKIHKQHFEIFEIEGMAFFFKTENDSGKFPFDIFSAAFYLLTRYEEYLPHAKDKYGRYDHKQSLAATHGFLKIPLINYWLEYFGAYIKNKFPGFNIPERPFTFLPTYDVDIAFEYLHKGIIKNAGKILKAFAQQNYKKIFEVFNILSGKEKDPYYNFEFLDKLNDTYGLRPLYFFLVSTRHTAHDKNIHPLNDDMQSLIRRLAEKYETGIHPSFFTLQNEKLLRGEKFLLEDITTTTINKSRQHYLRFNLPGTYRKLLNAGIKDEFSMGYGTINGFRVSYANSFTWYDIERDESTNLRVHPFCYMDSTAIFNQKNTPQESLEELMYYYNTCKKVKGTFICVMHNHLMGSNDPEWRDVYEQFLADIDDISA